MLIYNILLKQGDLEMNFDKLRSRALLLAATLFGGTVGYQGSNMARADVATQSEAGRISVKLTDQQMGLLYQGVYCKEALTEAFQLAVDETLKAQKPTTVIVNNHFRAMALCERAKENAKNSPGR